MEKKKAATMDVQSLVEVVEKLRAPGGCPWDREQTHLSLRKDLLEETYELLETIDEGNTKGLKEELGDVLLQVIFHAHLAQEEGLFTMQEVVEDICAKLIHRHPHVYGTTKVKDSKEVLVNWETLKAEEKKERTKILDGVTRGMPALMRAYKIQKKAAKVGFDWNSKSDVWAKVQEEMQELTEAVAEGDLDQMEWELGDILLALTNYGRHLGLEPEVALNRANNRFQSRFEFIEKTVALSGRPWADFTLGELEELWQRAKKSEKK